MQHETNESIASALRERLLTTAEAADILGVTEWTLRRWRSHGSRLPYRKLSDQMIRYTLADIQWFIEDSQVRPVEEA